MLVTATELAGYLQQDLDTYTATQAITNASTRFETEADTRFSVATHIWTTEGYGQDVIMLPRRPVAAVTSVTVDGVAVTDYALRGASLYRIVRWGGTSAYAADVVITYTYGYTSAPDDVKEAVLVMAAQAYSNPDGLSRTQVDDYIETRDATLPIDWRATAAKYRVGAVA